MIQITLGPSVLVLISVGACDVSVKVCVGHLYLCDLLALTSLSLHQVPASRGRAIIPSKHDTARRQGSRPHEPSTTSSTDLLVFPPSLLRLAQTAMAFHVIQTALSVIVKKIKTLASMTSEVDRLHGMLETMDALKRKVSSWLMPITRGPRVESRGKSFRMKSSPVRLPKSRRGFCCNARVGVANFLELV